MTTHGPQLEGKWKSSDVGVGSLVLKFCFCTCLTTEFNSMEETAMAAALFYG